jgi:hypothetical protein
LWDEQKGWVRSYATACGVPPDRPPPYPVWHRSRRASSRPPSRASPTFRYGVTAGGARRHRHR